MNRPLPTYDRSQTYRWNYDHAPEPKVAEVPEVAGKWTFCGRPVPSPLGIAAGPLLNGKWILYYAALGFDVLTYKTTRSIARDCYPLPNLAPVQTEPLATAGTRVRATEWMDDSWAISFGMPSMPPDIWRADVEWTRRNLPKEKILSVSVVASVQPTWSLDDLADDFARCARWAIDSGADCVETNFSCPNVSTTDGQLYQLPKLAAHVARRVRDVVGAVPYLVKLGFVPDQESATELIDALCPVADALVMTNSISATVERADGVALFGGNSRGIGGTAILAASVEQVRRFSTIIHSRGYSTKVIGVGGISNAAHVHQYFAAGAECVQLATSAMLDPLVGCQIRREL